MAMVFFELKIFILLCLIRQSTFLAPRGRTRFGIDYGSSRFLLKFGGSLGELAGTLFLTGSICAKKGCRIIFDVVGAAGMRI